MIGIVPMQRGEQMRAIDADALEGVLERIPDADIKNIDGQAYVLVRLSQVFNVIKNALTIESEQRWIPVTERLPDKSNFYICTKKNRLVKTVWYSVLERAWEENVIAWRDLPEPYGGKQE